MKIKNISLEKREIALQTPFITALRRVETIEFVRVFVECEEGSIGIGEAPATFAITGEDIGTIVHSVENIQALLINLSLNDALLLLHKQNIGSSAKASLDMAIMMLLGANRLKSTEPIKTDITISFNAKERMLRDAKKAISEGMDILKIKLASDINHAVEVTKFLSKELPKAKLLIDANQAWSLEESLHYVQSVKNIPLELIEQPVKAEDLDSLKIITKASLIPILADEAVFTLLDVKKVMESKSADMINIKLMKCGGVSRAIEILEYAREHHIKCMLGSMLEGPYSINAALYLAFNYRDVIEYIDLDSPLLYKEKSLELDFTFEQNRINFLPSPETL